MKVTLNITIHGLLLMSSVSIIPYYILYNCKKYKPSSIIICTVEINYRLYYCNI